ncbi:MAG: AMP-binding protein [Deltaproteobacteria bacterium]|nr:AMP-binding protein [Deltaproteobacteria bacterium]
METLMSLIDGLSGYGEKPAVLTVQKGGMEMRTYRTLGESSRTLAQGLIDDGLSVGDTVAILAGAGAHWILACLAVVRAGGVVVPLDTQLDDDVLSGILKDCGARWIFADAGGMERLKRINAENEKTILLDGDLEDQRIWRRTALDDGGDLPSARASDRAILFYTSGTTGPPKGVPLTHKNITFQLDTLVKTGLIGKADRMLLPLPLHHAYPLVIGVLGPLASGVPVIFPRSLTGPEILRAVREGEATILIGVPRLYQAMYGGIESMIRSRSNVAGNLFNSLVGLSGRLRERAGLSAGKWLFKPLHKRIGPKLSILASGGSALDPLLARKLEGLGWQVSVGYGLTETAPLLTLDPPGKIRIGSVGRPISGVEIRIDSSAGGKALQQRGTETKPTGEIQARGPNIFSGYHNMPERTKESFTDDAWFRTGDLGYFDDDGYLFITGRLSALIVTPGGENIQPKEVETSYGRSPMIREIGIFQEDGKLTAVVIPEVSEIRKRGLEDIPQAVKRAIEAESKRIPSYQRISDFVISREPLERTRLGKVKRHLLHERYDRAKDRANSGGRDIHGPISFEDMSTEDRELLNNRAATNVWNLLARRYHDQPLSPDASPLLDLGIDSMGWLNLTLEIAQRTGVELDDRAIGEIDVVRDLLRKVSEASGSVDTRRPEVSFFEYPERFLSRQGERWLEPLGPRMTMVVRILFLFNRFLIKNAFGLNTIGREHLPLRGPFVMAPNHISYLDPFALAAALEFQILRQTYWGGWTGAAFANWFNRFISRLGQVVPIDPEKAALSSLAFGAEVLKRERSLVWFPEGQRSHTGELQAFKSGIGFILNHFPVKVVPVLIQGADQALPPGRFLKRFHPITVVFGKPIDPRELERRGKGERPEDRIAQGLEERIAEMKRGYEGKKGFDFGMGTI